MPLTPADIIKDYPDDGSSLQRVAHRKVKAKIAIVEYNPLWPQYFQAKKTDIQSVLGSTALEINHAGSTSVPNLPAKDIIDMDLVVGDINDEASYVPQLESLGFRFLFREPKWHEHRFFVNETTRSAAFPTNLHVFGPECPEVERHRIFRDWLRRTPDDMEFYARVKRVCARVSEEKGENMQEYTDRKDACIREIRGRAFRELGWVQ